MGENYSSILTVLSMAKILADHQIRELVGDIIINGDENLIDPNGIKLRLGSEVKFHSTGEKRKLSEGKYLKVHPGESVSFSSAEKIDFSSEKVHNIFPTCSLMGFLTPTTSMMREGMINSSTKIDPGFRGELNWSLRNGSSKDFILEYLEPIVKLTVYLLKEDENPDLHYGERDDDHYQDTSGIVDSTRKIRADISDEDVVESSFKQLDPKKQLKEAGHPFSYIGKELTELQGKIQIVSTDMGAFKEEIKQQTASLSGKIDKETESLSERIDRLEEHLMIKVEQLLSSKIGNATAWLVGIGSFLVGIAGLLYGKIDNGLLFAGILIIGLLVSVCIMILNRKKN